MWEYILEHLIYFVWIYSFMWAMDRLYRTNGSYLHEPRPYSARIGGARTTSFARFGFLVHH